MQGISVISLRRLRDSLRHELRVYQLVLRHPETPRASRLLLGAAVAYALSPIDLIPDWVPVIGHIDDILIVPLLVWLAVKFVPSEVIEECRAAASAA